MKYRPDIDGLRALAVLPVVVFHAHLGWLEGGFVGVDVFFVISGYLITALILEERAGGRFSLLRFYQRRVLRIFPALILVALAVLIFGWIVATPGDLRHIGASLVALPVFQSNFLFWREAGYFAGAAYQRPLLHTWSLAVEEQFYLFYPLYLLLLRGFDGRLRRRLTLILWAASFAVGAAGVVLMPQAAFYFLPTRIWELLTGGLLAMGLGRAPRSGRESLSARWLGLLLIAGAILFYRTGFYFPGPAALVPVLGAALVIWSGFGAARRPGLLAHPWLVFLGRVSYPLYLWHLPVFTAVFYLSIEPPSHPALFGWFLLSLLLAIATWRWIERPIQAKGRTLRPLAVLLSGAVAMGLIGVAGGLIYLNDGVERRFSREVLQMVDVPGLHSPEAMACKETGLEDLKAGRFCVLGAKDGAGKTVDTIVWGDSIAESLAPGVDTAAARRGKGIALAFFYGCALAPPQQKLQAGASLWQRDCAAHRAAVFAGIAANPDIRRVVLAHRWLRAIQNEGVDGLVAALRAIGKEVWIVGPTPVVPHNLPHALYVQSWGLELEFDPRPRVEAYRSRFAEINRHLKEMEAAGLARIVDLIPDLCDAERCRVVEGRHPLYYDNFHLSLRGALAVSSAFDRIFDDAR